MITCHYFPSFIDHLPMAGVTSPRGLADDRTCSFLLAIIASQWRGRVAIALPLHEGYASAIDTLHRPCVDRRTPLHPCPPQEPLEQDPCPPRFHKILPRILHRNRKLSSPYQHRVCRGHPRLGHELSRLSTNAAHLQIKHRPLAHAAVVIAHVLHLDAIYNLKFQALFCH